MSSTKQQWLDQVGGVLETLNQGVIINHEARRVVFANSMFLEMIKMSAAGEPLGRSIVDLYPPEDVINLLEFIGRREAQGRDRYEFYVPQPDGGVCLWQSPPGMFARPTGSLSELSQRPT